MYGFIQMGYKEGLPYELLEMDSQNITQTQQDTQNAQNTQSTQNTHLQNTTNTTDHQSSVTISSPYTQTKRKGWQC